MLDPTPSPAPPFPRRGEVGKNRLRTLSSGSTSSTIMRPFALWPSLVALCICMAVSAFAAAAVPPRDASRASAPPVARKTIGVMAAEGSKTAGQSLCPKEGQCPSPVSRQCEDEVTCLLDPCDNNECEEGEECDANYCGGCHAVCSASMAVADAGTISTAIEAPPEIVYDDFDAVAPEDGEPDTQEGVNETPLAASEEPQIVYDNFDAVVPEESSPDTAVEESATAEEASVQVTEKLSAPVKSQEGGDGDVTTDGAEGEETDVHDAAEELVEDAEEEEEETKEKAKEKSKAKAEGDDVAEEGVNEKVKEKSKADVEGSDVRKYQGEKKASVQKATKDVTSAAPAYKEASAASDAERSHRSAWVAHGVIGTIAFGLFVPAAISSAFLRDLVPTYWIYVHVIVNVVTFVATFFAVGIAFATMNGMGSAGEGHMKEVHHITGLLLLLIVSFQTGNGFLRPPKEFYTDDARDNTPGAVLKSSIGNGSMTARTLWYLVHSVTGLVVFALGTFQVRSGLGLFSRRYGTSDYGLAYVGYAGWLAAIMLIGKGVMKWKEHKAKLESMEMQMGRKGEEVGKDWRPRAKGGDNKTSTAV